MTSPAIDMMGVILAAGKGRRIQPFTQETPKPLLPILDRPLILWQIETMRDLGITDIVILIGHLAHRVVQTLGDGSQFGVRLRYVEQSEVLGIAHAVGCVQPLVDRPFLLFLGDIFFETENLGDMLELFAREDIDAVLAVKEEDDPQAIRRNFTVALNDEGLVKRVIEKPVDPRTNLKGCGLYLFAPTIFDAVHRTPRTAYRDEYELTDSIQIFIDYGYRVAVAPVIQRDLNLSEPADLLHLNLGAMRSSAADRYIAGNATVDPGATVHQSVVMSGAHIESGVELDHCLVMPRERIQAGSYQNVIFVGGEEISCH